MPLGFPTNPSNGQTYVIGSTTYVWNGQAWIVSSSLSNITGNAGTFTGIVTITTTTQSTTTNTGGLVVIGGVGIGGNLNVGGNVSIQGSISGTGTGTSAVNVTTGTFETLLVTSTTNAISTISGALQVRGGVGIGGDVYIGGTLYSGASPVLTTANFTATVVDGIDIDIVDTGGGTLAFNNVSTLQTVTGRGNSTTNIVRFLNTTQSTSTDTGAVIVTGGVGVGGRINAESVRIADAVLDSTQTLVNTTSSTIIDTFDIGEFRSAKYLIQIDEGTGVGADFELIEILLVGDNNGMVYATEYGVVTSNGYLGDFNAEYTGTTVSLYFTAYAATNKTVKVLRTGMAA